MKTLSIENNSILIEIEKKKLFSSQTVKKTEEISLDDIESLSREEFDGKLNSMTIIKKDGNEVFMTLEDFENLDTIYQFLLKQRDSGKNYEICLIDIGSGDIQKI